MLNTYKNINVIYQILKYKLVLILKFDK